MSTIPPWFSSSIPGSRLPIRSYHKVGKSCQFGVTLRADKDDFPKFSEEILLGKVDIDGAGNPNVLGMPSL